ncbi:glyoxalase [Pseudoclavibacter chungangensis]|uniref:Glyoxalase n=1 Tax=Pseudoclavibacter chungangensis TaxID=587635 RepID=A0A7J5C428_9MICO|nr:VOC family protein [Pseudoclavibacter chungangensis]KAB1662540.1 glyoxalase [Pseudoclavibacter chungangensis]NYJ68580.1 catechol 2,3-dioxygenase-like lactoylglutathione lyase family enzyme [Pseudoclavibacter chungangensis]
MTGLHHVELWVPELAAVEAEWAWLFERVGFADGRAWPGGRTWTAGGVEIVLTESPTMHDAGHDRRRSGVNHLAFRAGTAATVDATMAGAASAGWRPLYQDRYPFAGGPQHYAGWLENASGFKVELVADDQVRNSGRPAATHCS